MLVALGALPVLLVWVYHLFALSIDPLESLWYLLLLVTGHSLGLASVLIGCLWLGALGALLELTYRTPRERPGAERAQRAAGVRARALPRPGVARRHRVRAPALTLVHAGRLPPPPRRGTCR